ncbi:MAG TPA: Bpu10I family restriction endonuclease [Nostocaceae cyanobacterium]|nr:Bpu10I family restriction endonuclease [Nostocaceae cyanobacterium]
MIKVQKSQVHGDKLKSLLDNKKLPSQDKPHLEKAIKKYENWIADLENTQLTGDALLKFMVDKLNEYKNFIDLEFIFDSPDDFLYRQKGQLKLDNSIIEEFLPRLFDQRLVPGFARLTNIECGSRKSFAGLSFESPFIALSDGGAFIKTKDQDFAVTKAYKINITENPPTPDIFSVDINVSYFATEIKTNLDKTMFQEASQTASELKKSVSGCKYIIICEWLDMTPINTKLTPIDEVIVLRKAKRIPSNIRTNFSTAQGRQNYREFYVNLLQQYPLNIDSFQRLLFHLNECFPDTVNEDDVLKRGYF